MLMIVALFTSYFLQQRKVTAIHETVASIFAGALCSLANTLMRERKEGKKDRK